MSDLDGPSGPTERIYAIGDVHGRFDLFRRLLNIIRSDHVRRGAARTRIILLGDIVDRGPDAAKMVQGCMSMTGLGDQFIVLKGNHEEMMIQALKGDFDTFRAWLEFGGRETLISWGVDPALLALPATRSGLRKAAKAVGSDVLAWLDRLPLYVLHNDFLFVHAGIRPAVPITQQDPNDLLWITDDFLQSNLDHGMTVVHGHSIVEDGPDVRSNRIGIDTGAYRTERLTAIGIEGEETWYLDTDTRVADNHARAHPRASADPEERTSARSS